MDRHVSCGCTTRFWAGSTSTSIKYYAHGGFDQCNEKTTETFPAMATINLYSIQYDDDLVFCRLGVDTSGNTTDECNLQSFVHGGDLESMCDTGAVL
mgnify:CR=1 FL=1